MGATVSETVTVRQGTLRGVRQGEVLAFLGIPYAAAPFGPRRLRPPAPPEPWPGVRAADRFGATVPKADYVAMYVPYFPEVTIAGEDCLNLNVYTRPDAAGAPVLVWIHGGAFTNGSNSVPEYDGSAFARDGVVTVVINYRLAAEGFLYVGDEVANVGIQDQIAALRWVRDNIAAFGGDPGRVTVAGESAGAWSVNTLLATPAAKGLFQQAISQSGGAHHHLAPEQARQVAAELARNLGIEPTRAAFATVDPDKLALACREVITELQTAPDPAKWGTLALTQQPYVPTVDGRVLPRPTLEAIAAGAGAEVRLLIGTTADEARTILVASGALDAVDEELLTASVAAYGLPADEALPVYRRDRPAARPGEVLSAVVSDWYFRIPSIRVAEARGGDTWMYRFDWASPTLGSGHAVDIPFAFDTLHAPGLAPRLGDAPPQAVADTDHRIWVDFATTGDPGWPRYDTATRATALITDTLTVVSDPAGHERVLWEGRR
ncbi:carboxylesterase/lipase family protein [Nocardia sp. alder85J]|uniref:carboxylesterase/lipase family protein n=1 Tax=Nocardia sp. alder85J TaxID=2862949 RepID=UPI001CD577CB|nr:carboxylesterase family protein [Nocardia sp. alder85J]MCX4092654.1 carboxylesterase family protein [Nocardia sp. alder85J]